MTITVDRPATGQDLAPKPLRVVLSGSFRRDRQGLERALGRLRDEFDVLSPASLDFINDDDDFVRLPSEVDTPIEDVEGRHLAAITASDFVWLHAPEGYVGSSAALEVGHALAVGVPVFTDAALRDPTLAVLVNRVGDPRDVPVTLVADPGRGLAGLQDYYGRVAQRRGWHEESARDTLLMLTEELGELAREVRRETGLARSGGYGKSRLGHEIADVQLYLVHLANVMGVDLAAAVTEKERVNGQRHRDSSASAA